MLSARGIRDGIVSLAVCLSALAGAASAQQQAWRTQYGSELPDPRAFFEFFGLPTGFAVQAASAPDGSHYSVVSIQDNTYRAQLIRRELSGEVAWTRPLPGNGIGSVVATDEASNVYVSDDDFDGCGVLEKRDTLGAVLWSKETTDGTECVRLTAIVVVSGKVYVAGDNSVPDKIYAARLSADGAEDWSFTRAAAPGTQSAVTAIAVDSQGALLVAATHATPTVDYLVLKIASDGELAWERSYDGGSLDVPLAIAIGADDRVAVSGFSVGEGAWDYQTIQYDATGNVSWSARIERESQFGVFWWNPLGPAIAFDSNGNLFLSGAVGPQNDAELLLVKHAPTGAEIFHKTYPHYAEGRRMVIDENDRVYVAAPVLTDGQQQGAVFAFTSDGALDWVEKTAPSNVNMPAALTLGGGRLVMTATVAVGESEETLREGALWLGLDAEGAVWEVNDEIKGLADLYCGSGYTPDLINRKGRCLARASDGAIHLAGSGAAPQFFDHRHQTVKLRSDGSLDWARGFLLEGDGVDNDGATTLALAASGVVSASGPGGLTVAYAGAGEEQWVRNPGLNEDVRSSDVDSAGSVYVLGRLEGDIETQKYLADGTVSWARTFDGASHGDDAPFAQIVTTDDRIVLVGETSVVGGVEALAHAYDVAGDVVFSRTFDAVGGHASLSALTEAPGGGLVVAGRADSATDFNALVVRLDPAGNVDWRRDLDSDAVVEDEHGDDEANAVAIDPAGNTYIAGRTWNGDDFDVFIVKLDTSGDEVWRRAIDLGSGDDEAWATAFDAPGPGGTAGSLWIAGRASNGNDTDALTMRFDVDGNEIFRALVAGTEQRDDEHYDLVIGPVGHATVAGVSAEIDESYNFQAIHYVIAPLDVDYDGEAGALTDGLLIQRWMLGLETPQLELGVVDPLCVRCPAAMIEDHLEAIKPLLDVDGDGAMEQVTDGVLVLRWLFGFRGATLTIDAIDPVHCTRCDATSIEAYLDGLAD